MYCVQLNVKVFLQWFPTEYQIIASFHIYVDSNLDGKDRTYYTDFRTFACNNDAFQLYLALFVALKINLQHQEKFIPTSEPLDLFCGNQDHEFLVSI